MFSRLLNFLTTITSRSLQFLLANIIILWYLSVLVGMIVSISHIPDLFTGFGIFIDWILAKFDFRVNFFLVFLLKLIIFCLIVFPLVGTFTSVISIFLIPVPLMVYPYVNVINQISTSTYQYSNWVNDLYFLASSVFWIALIVLFFSVFSQRWNDIWRFIIRDKGTSR